MATDKKVIVEEAFPSNSHKSKSETDTRTGPKIEKVVKGKVVRQKKGLGKKFSETIMGEETKGVWDYVLQDVLIHAAKTMICDMVGWGGAAEMILFGDRNGGRGGRKTGSGAKTSYTSYYSGSNGGRSDSRREMSRTGRARHDFDEIVLETRGEAEEVLSNMVGLCIDYGMASVSDLYEYVGIQSNYTDAKWGWTNLSDAHVSRVRDGYLINLPRAKPLD